MNANFATANKTFSNFASLQLCRCVSNHKSHNEISLPESLKRQFALLERRLLRIETAAAACVGLPGAIYSYAFLFFRGLVKNGTTFFRVMEECAREGALHQ